MKKFIGFIICFIFCIFLASCSDGGSNNGERLLDSARNIKIVQIEGSATVTDDTETVDCFKGMNLYDGDTLNVGKDSVIVVKFDEDKYVYLGENSKVNIKSEGKDKFKTNVFVEMGVVLAEIQNKLGEDEEFFLSSNNSVMAVRGTIFGVTVRDDGSQYIETYSVYRGTTELVVFDKINGRIIKGKLTDLSNSKIEIKVPKDHVIPTNDFNDILSNWLSDVNDKFNNPDDANDKLDEVQITVTKPTEADYEEVLGVINDNNPNSKTDGNVGYSDIEYTATGYFGEYDGEPHSISITTVDKNAKVYYMGEGETEYKEINDYQFYAPGIYRVYYKITCPGSADKVDYEVIYITKPTIKLTSDHLSFDNDTQSAVLSLQGISNTSFNRYNGVLASEILANAQYYINNEDVTNKVTSVIYNKKIDNYIELVNGKNTLNVTFDFGTFTINQDVNFLFVDTREDLGYLIGSQSADLQQLSGNLYYYHTTETTGEPMYMDGNDLLTMFGLDVEDLTTMLINYPNDTLENDADTYDGTHQVEINRYMYAELDFLVFPTSTTKGYNDKVYVYIGPDVPTDYPVFTIKNLDYAYNPAKDANGILVDFIDTKTNTVTYSLDGTNYQESIRITDAGSYKVYYKVSNGENTVEGYEYINVLVGQGVITFDNLKFITNPVHIFSNDGNDLSYTYRDEYIDKTGYVTSDNGTITSLDDAYLVYSGLVKNAKFYDSITKDEINATVTISEKKGNSANFNYTIVADGYDTVTGSVRFAYTEIGYFEDTSSVPEFGVTLPTDYEVSLTDVPTVVPSRTSTEMENSIINYQCYYSVDEGKTWTKTAPKITEAGEYSVYTLYCFVDKGNDATDLVDGELSNTAITDFAATGNFIIAVQNIKVTA